MITDQPAKGAAAAVKEIADRLLQSELLSSEAWGSAIRAKKFDDAIRSIEEFLTANGADPKIRLWWVRCQLEIGKLPLSALCAPLDELYEKVVADPAIVPLAAGVYTRAAAGLAEKNQLRLAVSTMERAADLAAKSQHVQSGDLRSLREQFKILISEERTRAETRRENRAYIKTLDDRLARVQAALAASAAAPTEAPKRSKPSARKMLSAKSIVLEANSEPAAEAPPGGGAATDAPEPQFPARPAAVPILAAERRIPRFSKRTVRSAIFLAIVLSALIFLPRLWSAAFPTATAQSVAQISSAPVLAFVPNQAALPSVDLSRIAAVNDDTGSGSNLEAVHNRIKNLEIAQHGPAATPAAETNQTENKAQADPEVDQAALHWKGAATPPTPAQTGFEPEPGIAGIDDNRPKDQLVDRSKVPVLDPNQITVTSTDSIGTGRGVTAVPGIIRSSDGRIYGPPMEAAQITKDTIQREINGSGRGLDGNPVHPVEVQQFVRPVSYRTIAPTKVLSAPSIVSSQVERLPVESKVEVTARMGQWLEIRSIGGRVGYIYAQDAVETK